MVIYHVFHPHGVVRDCQGRVDTKFTMQGWQRWKGPYVGSCTHCLQVWRQNTAVMLMTLTPPTKQSLEEVFKALDCALNIHIAPFREEIVWLVQQSLWTSPGQ